MLQKLNTNQDSTHKSPVRLTIVIVSLWLLITIAIIVAAVINLRGNQLPQALTITNYSALPVEVPSSAQADMDAQIYYVLKNHFDVPDSRHTIEATLRPDTYQSISVDGLNGAEFIVDVDAYQQTYRIKLIWSDDPDTYPGESSVECVPKTESKYPDVMCYGQYYDSNSPQIYLPYTDQLESGEIFVASRVYQDPAGQTVIEISVPNCGDQTIKDAAIAATKSYLKSAGLDNPEQYVYSVPSSYDQCLK